MSRNKHMEIAGILSLSLILTSAFSISSCLPEMLKAFPQYDRSDVEFLISLPAVAMVVMIALSPMISEKINERMIIGSGLALTGIAGLIPFFCPSYPVIFFTRILLGTGIGLVNTRAVNLIGERFFGEEKAKLMGIRSSMETLGQAALTFCGGQLLLLGWQWSFLIYGTAFIILIVYFVCVPTEKPDNDREKTGKPDRVSRLGRREWRQILKYFLLGGLAVSASSANSLRIPLLMVEKHMGTASDGATILSISVLAGFLGGFAFGRLTEKLKSCALPFFLLMTAAGMVLLSFSESAVFVACGAAISGFFVTACISYGLNGVSENMPREALNTATAAVLIGCNLGSSVTPFFLRLIGRIREELSFGFLVYALVLAAAAAAFFCERRGTDSQER